VPWHDRQPDGDECPPNGYSIAWVRNNNAIGVSLLRTLDRQEMRPIVIDEFAYVAVDALKIQDAATMVERGQEKPGTLSVRTSSAGTSSNLALLLNRREARFTVVPYRGPTELAVALLRNDVDLVINAYGGLRSAIEAKQVRPLAVTSVARISELPGVPTMAEAGVPDFEVTSWNALYGPKDNMPEWLNGLGRSIGALHLQNTDFQSDSHWGWPDKRGLFDVAAFAGDVRAVRDQHGLPIADAASANNECAAGERK
jgi:hypothetical protein